MTAHCPKCGQYVSQIKAKVVGWLEPECIDSVSAVCWRHGMVDVSDQDWWWEDFYPEEVTECS